MNSSQLREKFLQFFEERGSTIVPSASLLPTDPSVLFTTAGMQQFKPYYLGEKSPFGPNVVSIQKCIRTSDIEEVGDERHLTFFEMLGNFSFGGYGKKEAIELAYTFITKELGLEIDYVTVFSPEKVPLGDWRKNVKEDTESFELWKKVGMSPEKIRKEGIDNFWGPTGDEGPCGPTTEIYVENIEVWNLVFNQFFCNVRKELSLLGMPGVDTGMGLERLAMVMQQKSTIFETDLFEPLMKKIPPADEKVKRITADHFRAAVFLIADGILPSNKDQGYILRRLLRRAMTYAKVNNFGAEGPMELLKTIIEAYSIQYPELGTKRQNIIDLIYEERKKFLATVERGLGELEKTSTITPESAFLLYQSFGLPFDIIKELDPEKTKNLRHEDFEKELKKHQDLSRMASAGMFKGGLADHDPKTIRLHTAHHLLLAALQEVFGKQVKQRGSNITQERLRIDFSLDHKLTDEEKQKIEDMVNEKIQEGLEVIKKEMPKEEAEKIGAEMEFGVKYGNTVSVYFILPMPEASRIRDGGAIGKDILDKVFSKEFCGGPHVSNTSELAAPLKAGEPRPDGRGPFRIVKEEAVSAGVRRIKAILQ